MKIIYDVGFRVKDTDLIPQLKKISEEIDRNLSAKGTAGVSRELAAATQQANALAAALRRASTDRGISFATLNQELVKSGTSAKQLIATLSAAGPAMSSSLNAALTTLSSADRSVIAVTNSLKEMRRIMIQSVRFNMAMQVQNFVSGQVQSAISWVRNLDSTLRDIAAVAPEVAGKLDVVSKSIIEGSRALRVTARDYADAQLIFWQQGLDAEEVGRRADITIKAARASGQEAAEMSEQLTAIWNTYQMQGDRLQNAASVAAKLGAETAADFEDISTGMQIAASAASQLGVEYESLAAMIATTVETTKQSATIVGNAYKTMFARLTNLSATKEGAVELGRISSQLDRLGVHILDAEGQLRRLDDVIGELGTNWETFSDKQQIAIAQVIGGTRQYQQIYALMENFGKYQRNLLSAQSETGADELERQFSEVQKSIKVAAENAAEQWQKAFSTIFSTDAQKTFYSSLESTGKIVEDIVESAGGLPGIMILVSTYLARRVGPELRKLQEGFHQWQDSLTPERQLAAAQRQFQVTSAAAREAHLATVTPGDYNARVAAEQALALTEKKLRVSHQVTEANIQLKDAVRAANESDKIRIETLRNQLEVLQKSTLEMQDQAALLREQATTLANQEYSKNNNYSGWVAAHVNSLAAAAASEGLSGVDNYAYYLEEIAADVEALIGPMMDFSQEIDLTNAKLEAMERQLEEAAADAANLEQAYYDESLPAGQAISVLKQKKAEIMALIESELQKVRELEAQGPVGEMGQAILKAASLKIKEYTAAADEIENSIKAAEEKANRMFDEFQRQQMAAAEQRRASELRLAEEREDLGPILEEQVRYEKYAPIRDQIAAIQDLAEQARALEPLRQEFVQLNDEYGRGELSTEQYHLKFRKLIPAFESFRGLLDKSQSEFAELSVKLLESGDITEETVQKIRHALHNLRSAADIRIKSEDAEAAMKNLNRQAQLVAAEVRSQWGSLSSALGQTVSQVGMIAYSFSHLFKQMQSGEATLAGTAFQISIMAPQVISLARNYEGLTRSALQLSAALNAKALGKTSEEIKTLTQSIASAKGGVKGMVEAAGGIKTLLPILGKFAVILAAVAAVIAVAKDAFDELKASTPEGQLEAAKEATQGLTEAAREAAKEAEELTEAFGKYDQAVSALDSATKGTEQWRDALAETNQQALDLLQKFSQMEGIENLFVRDADGRLVVDEAERQALTRQARANADASRYAAQTGSIREAEARLNARIASVITQLAGGQNDVISQAVVGGIVSAYQGAGDSLVDNLDKVADRLRDAIAKNANLEGAYRPILEELEKIGAESQRVKTLSQKTSEIIAQSELINSSAAEQRLAAARHEQAIAEETQKVLAEARSMTRFASSTDVGVAKLMADYSAALGKSVTAGDNVVRYGAQNRQFNLSIDGAEARTISAEEIATTIATRRVLERIEEFAEQGTAALNRFGENADEIRALVTDGDFRSLTRDQVSNLRATVDASGVAGLLSDGTAVGEIEFAAKALGFKGAQEFIKTVEENLKIEEAWDSLEALKKYADQVLGEPLSLDAAQALNEQLVQLEKSPLGEDGVKIFLENLKTLTNDTKIYSEVVKRVDWSQWNAAEKAATIVKNMGGELGLTTAQMKRFTDHMRLVGGALPNEAVQELADAGIKLSTALSKLDAGQAISQDDVDLLAQYGAKVDELFIKAADGSHILVKPFEALHEVGVDETLDDLGSVVNTLARAREEANSFDWQSWASGVSEFAEGNIVFGLIDAGPALERLLVKLGYTDEVLRSLIGNKEGIEELRTRIQNFALAGDSAADSYRQLGEAVVANSKSLDDVSAMFAAGLIASETAIKGFQLHAHRTVESIDELETAAYTMAREFGNAAAASEMFAGSLDKVAAKQAKSLGLDPEELDAYASHLMSIATTSDTVSDVLAEDRELALQAATAIMRFGRAVEKTASKFEEWADVLQNTDRSSLEFLRTIEDIRKAMADALNIDGKSLSTEFLGDSANLKLMEEAINGSAQALYDLQEAAARDIFMNITPRLEDEGILAEAQTLFDQLLAARPDITIAPHLDEAGFIEAANQLLSAVQLTTEEANRLFGSMGFNVDLESKPGKSEINVPEYTTYSAYEFDGPFGLPSATRTHTVQTGSKKIESEFTPIAMRVHNAERTTGGNISGQVPRPSGGRGGGGRVSAPRQEKAVKADKSHERYADVNKAIERTTAYVQRYSAAEDKAFGAQRIAVMRRKDRALADLGQNYDRLAKEAKAYLAVDQKVLKAEMAKKGFKNVKFNDLGFVSNPEQLQKFWDSQTAAAANAYNNWIENVYNRMSGAAQQEAADRLAAEKAKYDAVLEWVKAQQDLLNVANDSAQKFNEAMDKAVANIHEWLSNKLTEVEYKMELRMSINDRDIRILEQLLGQLGERTWAKKMDNWAAQVREVLANTAELEAGALRYQEIINNLDPSKSVHTGWFKKKFGAEAWSQFLADGHITQEMMDHMGKTADEMLGTIDELHTLNENVWSTFHDAIQTFLGDFDRLISAYDSHESILESWADIWSIAGQPWRDQTKAIDLLNKGLDTQQAAVQGVYKKYQFMTRELKQAEAVYLNALKTHGSEHLITQKMKAEWEQLKADTLKTQAELQGNIAELMRSIEGAAQESARVISQKFTEGLNGIFAEVDSAMELFGQKKQIDNFFLHDEDAQFELQKMLRETAKEMEGAVDPDLLKNYHAWVDKVNKLKDSGAKISQKELDILKAEFDLEKAKANFKEGQKTTLRLSRDNQGNWSYFYDVDETKEGSQGDMEQKLHNLRKMHRDAADEASEAWLRVWSDYRKYIEEIDWQRYRQNEAYRKEVDTRMSWYKEQLNQHASAIEKHNGEIGRSFSEMTLSVITDMDKMSALNEKYQADNAALAESLKQNYDSYQNKAKEALDSVGISQQNLGAIVQQQSQMILEANQMVGESLNAMAESAARSMDGIVVHIQNWGQRWREEISMTIDKMYELINTIQEMQKRQAGSAASDSFGKMAEIAQAGNRAGNYGKYFSGPKDQNIGAAAQHQWDTNQKYRSQTEAAAKYLSQATGQQVTGQQASDFLARGGITYVDGRWVKWDGKRRVPLQDTIESNFLRWLKNPAETPLRTGGLVTRRTENVTLAEEGPELVLNATDTQNLLRAVEILRDSLATRIGDIRVSSLPGATQPSVVNEGDVIINADFPNVSARQEIEAAFESLALQAKHYKLRSNG